MPTAALLLLIATLLPLGSFLLLIFMGKRLGEPLSGWVATALIAGSLVCSLGAMVAWFNGGDLAGITWGPGDGPIELSFKWLPVGPGAAQDHPGFVDGVIYIDSLTVAMFNLITLVAPLVHAFAIAHFRGEKRFAQFFTFLSMTCFAMLGFVLSGSLIQWFVFWQWLAVGSYLLIGFRQEDPAATGSALRSWLLFAAADVAFLTTIGILVHNLGNLTMSDLLRTIGSPPQGRWTTFAALGLLIAAMAKSAQFPLHGWIIASADAPSPAIALLQSVTSTAAGVYLIARMLPMFSPSLQMTLAIIGLITLIVGGLLSIVQRDIHQVLGFHTMSQMGFIFLALGIGSWMGGLFQLMTHAFFKSLLFLSAGVIVRGKNGDRNLLHYGGFMRQTPLTAVAFAIGALAAMGTPFMSGYLSQQMLLTHAGAFADSLWQGHRDPLVWLFFILPVIGAGLGAFALVRCWMLTFWGAPRDAESIGRMREVPALWFPLAALAGLSILGGSRLLDISRMLSQAIDETENYCLVPRDIETRPSGSILQTWPVDQGGTDVDESRAAAGAGGDAVKTQTQIGAILVHRFLPWSLGIGAVFAAIIGLSGGAAAMFILRWRPLNQFHELLLNRLYVDDWVNRAPRMAADNLSHYSMQLDRRIAPGNSDRAGSGPLG
jgi:NADH:ubiquinone oxidoreductase subunit 5 (subunit L)/multisubunit Na+/H+ antiporter MnhA subunit